MDSIKIGIIGCSRIAKRSVIPAIIKSKYAEIEIIGSGCGTDTVNFEIIIDGPGILTSDFSMDTNYLNIAIGDEVLFTNNSIGANIIFIGNGTPGIQKMCPQ